MKSFKFATEEMIHHPDANQVIRQLPNQVKSIKLNDIIHHFLTMLYFYYTVLYFYYTVLYFYYTVLYFYYRLLYFYIIHCRITYVATFAKILS